MATNNDSVSNLSPIFDLLDRWRHLPNYQLERRADIFFALYLPAFLAHHLKIPLIPRLIPEFPIRRGTIGQIEAPNLSCKADYLAIAEDRSSAFLIELKTDSGSRRDGQDDYLSRARAAGLRALVEGVLILASKSDSRRKYSHLLAALADLGLLILPAGWERRTSAQSLRGLDSDLKNIQLRAGDIPLRILYLQPRATKQDEIGFDQFADWLTQFPDPLSTRFRQSLLEWHTRPAGQCP